MPLYIALPTQTKLLICQLTFHSIEVLATKSWHHRQLSMHGPPGGHLGVVTRDVHWLQHDLKTSCCQSGRNEQIQYNYYQDPSCPQVLKLRS